MPQTRGRDDTVPIRWQCPEAVLTRVYTAKSDVYSFGVLLYEVFSKGRTPHGNLASSEVLRMVKAGELLARPTSDTPEDVFALMRACTALSVSQRPSMATAQATLSGAWMLDAQVSTGAGSCGMVLNPLMSAGGEYEEHALATDAGETYL